MVFFEILQVESRIERCFLQKLIGMLHLVYFDLSWAIFCLGDLYCLSLLAKSDQTETEEVVSKIAPNKHRNKQKIIIF